MGPQLEYLETILTCKGNFYAPDFSSHLDDLKCRLQELVFSGLDMCCGVCFNTCRLFISFFFFEEACLRLKQKWE